MPASPPPPPPPPPPPGAPPAAPPTLGSIDALKRVKEAEMDWEMKLRTARGQAAASLEQVRAQSETAVRAAQVIADGERTNTVLNARQEADHQAAEILASGRRAAEAAARGEGKQPSDKKDAILAAVLAGFLKE
jgi:vacuolar-type H+-ATPase subunit H